MGNLSAFAYALSGAAFAAFFFLAGWKLRDSLGVAKGEPPVILQRPKNTILDDWTLPEEDD